MGNSGDKPEQSEDKHDHASEETNPPNREKKQDAAKQSANMPTTNFTIYLNLLFTAVIAVSAFFTFLAICTQAVIYILQWEQMKKSNSLTAKAAKAAEDSVTLAREAARLDQRAWVALADVTQVDSPATGKKYQIRFGIRNTGKTFATDVRLNARCQVIPPGNQPDFSNEVSTDWRSRGLLPPESNFIPTIAAWNGALLTPDQVEQIKTGAVQVFLSGKITYTDIFGNEHWSTFCYSLIPGSDGIFQAYNEHNDADHGGL